MNRYLFLLFFVIFLTYSCQVEKIYQIPERQEIKNALLNKVLSDGATSIKGLNDGKVFFPNYSSSSLNITDTTTIDTVKFGRIITNIPDTTIVCEIHWDSAFIDISYILQGYYKVINYSLTIDSSHYEVTYECTTDFDTTYSIDSTWIDSLSIWDHDSTAFVTTITNTIDSTINYNCFSQYTAIDSFQKDFSHKTYQKALFIRKQNTNNAVKDWDLEKITPILFTNTDSSLRINNISLILEDGFPIRIELDRESENHPLDVFFTRDSLPYIFKDGIINFKIASNNYSQISQELGVAHLGREVNLGKKRKILNYSEEEELCVGTITPNSYGEKVYRLFIEIIDKETIQNSSSEYKSDIWMIPFQIYSTP